MKKVSAEKLGRFVGDVLASCGVDSSGSEAVSQSLVQANLRGIDSHGVRLLPTYAESADKGGVNKHPKINVKQTFPSCCCVDADNGFGAAAGFRAIDECIKIAENQGIGIASVINSSHCGYMAAYTLRAAAKGYMAFSFTNTGSAMLSYNGTKKYIGTNPICFAAPREESDPFCVDLATTARTYNSVELARLTGSKLDEGHYADAQGEITTDPWKSAMLLPSGGHKGFALGMMVEVLCSTLSGMAFGPHTVPMYGPNSDPANKRQICQTYVVFRPDFCIPADQFKRSLQQMTDEVRSQPAHEGKHVMMPGDPEINFVVQRSQHGIPLDDSTWLELTKLGEKYGVLLPPIVSDQD